MEPYLCWFYAICVYRYKIFVYYMKFLFIIWSLCLFYDVCIYFSRDSVYYTWFVFIIQCLCLFLGSLCLSCSRFIRGREQSVVVCVYSSSACAYYLIFLFILLCFIFISAGLNVYHPLFVFILGGLLDHPTYGS